jgi:glutaminase
MAAGVPGPVEALLDDVWRSVSGLSGGEVATYIPELAKADPATFGLSLATLDGHVYDAGDQVPFTIQSVSKPFALALALADRGAEAVLARVGVEPSGDAFNTISLDHVSGRAYNPMVNAGAIVTTALVGGDTRAEQADRLLDGLSAFAGRPLDVDEDVFVSERETGDRNRAIAYLMRSAGLLDDDVLAQVDLYFRQCSIVVTAHDVAVMSATLANGGVNPVTGVQVVPREVVGSVLTVMTTCGMYDYAGEWLFRVGLPAKSGVSGGVAAALPGQLGLGVHSPLLDARGNSVRGVAACAELSERLGLHLLLPSEQTGSVHRRSYRGDLVHSKRVWQPEERALIEGHGASIAVEELAGDQGFATTEQVVRLVREDPVERRWCVLDLRRVTHLDRAAVTLLRALVDDLTAEGTAVLLVEPTAGGARSALRALDTDVLRMPDAESALEWCEAQLLAERGVVDRIPDGLVALEQQELVRDLSPVAMAALAARTTTKVFTPGTVVFEEGAPADGLYFVGAGQVSVDVRIHRVPGRRRLNTIGAGSSFGELALVDGRPRSARVVALDPTICHVLSTDAFADLLADSPATAAELTLALARSLSERLRLSTAELAALEAR